MTAPPSLGLLLAVAGVLLLIAAVIMDFGAASTTRVSQYTPLLATVVAIAMILTGVWFFTP